MTAGQLLKNSKKTLTIALEERKLPIKALKERGSGFGIRDAAGGASRGKNLNAVAPEPEGRKRNPRVEPSRTSRVRAADLMGSMSGGAIRNLSGTAGMMIMLVSKQFETGFFFP